MASPEEDRLGPRAEGWPAERKAWLSGGVEVALFFLLLAAAAKLGSVTDWDNQHKYLALRTPYWPFYVLRTYPPVWSARIVFPVAGFAVAWVGLRAWLRGEGGRLSTLLSLVVGAFLFHLGLGIEHLGLDKVFTDTFLRPGMEYWYDAPLVHAGFLRRFPDVGGLTLHGATHPPGLPLLLAGVKAIGLRGPREAELLFTGVAALTAFPVHGAARRLGDEESARMAAALFLFVCSVSAFAVLCMDVVTMFLSAVALYGMTRVLDGELAGGAWLGLGLFAASMCNFVAMVLPLSFLLLLATRWQTPDRRRFWAPLAVAIALFLAAYAALWIGFGYDPFHVLERCMDTLQRTSTDRLRSRPAALLGSPVAFLGALGLPLGALALRSIGGALWRLKRRTEVRPALVLLAGVAPWALGAALGKPRGEVEHAYLLFVPLMVIGTAIAARHWYGRGGRWVLRFAVPLLALQSILVEVYLSTYW